MCGHRLRDRIKVARPCLSIVQRRCAIFLAQAPVLINYRATGYAHRYVDAMFSALHTQALGSSGLPRRLDVNRSNAVGSASALVDATDRQIALRVPVFHAAGLGKVRNARGRAGPAEICSPTPSSGFGPVEIVIASQYSRIVRH